MPMRNGYADKVFIITSGENMAIHAAANIAMAVDNFKNRGYAQLGGIILNRRDVPREEEKVAELADDFLADNLFFEAHESRENDTQTRTISCIRCAAYLRPFPRTHPQNRRVQTHSHGRAMLASATEIALPSCVAVFFCSSLRIHKMTF
jgi:hypothetical protein